jgi:CHAT domain-containing protein
MRRLTLVPDGPITDLPFAALRDSTGRYLIEDVALVYAEGSGGKPRFTTASRKDILIAGTLALDHALFPDLDDLRRTDEEVASVRTVYERPTVLTGAAVTRAALLRELERHELFHFAGHARVSTEIPEASHLVLGGQSIAFADAIISASEIAHLRLSKMRLVVLSACGESSDRDQRSGVNGLARAFLDAGASGVIASQWEADDEATTRLMGDLHRRMAGGALPDEALRQAQLALLSRPAGRAVAAQRTWAGFRYYARASWETGGTRQSMR